MYVTWGNLGPGPTLLRVAAVCEWAEGKTNEVSIADAIWTNVVQYTEFGPDGDKGWELLDPPASGDCDDLASCMKVAVEMIGVEPAYVRFVSASTNAGAGNCLDQDSRIVSNRIQYLILDFTTSGTNYNWNAYEGCCEVAENYYTFGLATNLKRENDYEILKALPCRQFWVTMQDDTEPGSVSNWVDLIENVISEEPKP